MSPTGVIRKLTTQQMATRQLVRRMNEERIACFDTGNLDSCIKDFVEDSRFIVSVPGAPDTVFAGVHEPRDI